MKIPCQELRCYRCKGEIYPDAEIYAIGTDKHGFVVPICADCLDLEWKELTTAEKAVALGYDHSDFD